MRASIDKPGRTIVAPCRIDIEQTNDSLHAHVEIEGVHVGPGDRVVVVDAPGLVAFGEQRDFVRVARITRATRLQRLMARIEGYLELTELYEVGFSEGRG
ncbi:MAG: hypothetical protein U1E28_05810 [Beijerinckiaceae bacterium]